MQTITIEPLRWQDDPCCITIQADDSRLEAYYQVTCPGSVETICCGRPVEELPRIVPLLAPSQHLTAALALDRLFQVDPPELARNMRSALLQAQYCTAHLRKIYFLMTGVQDPFADLRSTGKGVSRGAVPGTILGKIMHHCALAQEAEDMLGGRHDHPLTAVAGGVTRYLRQEHFERLAEICETMLPFSLELAELLRTRFLCDQGMLSPWRDFDLPTLPGLYLSNDGNVSFTGTAKNGARDFSADRTGDAIGLRHEAWTYQPFAYFEENGWQGLDQPRAFFHVGPLARFNAGHEAATPKAEEERQRMTACVGTPPVFKLTAAFGAMAIELIQAVETLSSLSTVEKLAGPALRTIPEHKTESTWAALETPRGLTWHQYRVDDAGIVQDVKIIDSHAANNALKCMLVRQLVNGPPEREEERATLGENASVALLPF